MKFKLVLIAVLCCFLNQTHAQSDVFTVVLDRGHSEVDKGATANNTTEYELLKSIVAQITGDVKSDINVIYYNENGAHLSIKDRVAAINDLNPDLVISIHMGAGSSPRQGTVYYNSNNTHINASEKYAQQLIQYLTRDAYYSTILTETANFKLLETVEAPAIMIEIGNMKAVRDVYYLQTNGAQRLQSNFTAFLNSLN